MVNQNAPQEPRRRIIRLKHFLILMFACIIAPIAAAGWTDLYRSFLERNAPQVVAVEPPRGIGSFPVTVHFRVTDPDAGLDEVVVRLRQKSIKKELARNYLKGKKSESIEVEIDGEKLGLEEGLARIEVRAFDRSFWSNAAEANLQLNVDYKKPQVEVLSTQHNARMGGSQLVLYRAYDEDLAVSGIKVGNKTFLGFPASGLDKEFKDQALFAAIYAVALDDSSEKSEVRVFAEDRVGNAVSSTFYNKIFPRNQKDLTVNLNEQFMREKIGPLADQYRNIRRNSGEEDNLPDVKSEDKRVVSDFMVANEKLRAFNEAELEKLLERNLRNDAYWTDPFLRQNATTSISFGDTIKFNYDDQEVGRTVNLGEELLLSGNQKEVLAVNGGIVLLSQELGVYGWTVAIDHGLGVTSVYSYLEKPLVEKGEEVSRGQAIGVVGRSGFARQNALHFEVRVQGTAVDPREWWEASWFYPHIIGKVNDLKRALGIPVYFKLKR